MQLTLLKCKLHRACVTRSELEYEGSCAIDQELMKLVGIGEYEQIHIYNVNNGERFTTYAIVAAPGSHTISINGAAARKAHPGDRIIICAYVGMDEAEAATFQPRMVYLDEQNKVLRVSDGIQLQQGQTELTL